MTSKVVYDNKTNCIQHFFIEPSNPERVITIINLENETIKDGPLSSERPLAEMDIYTFKGLLDQIDITNELIEKILETKFYTKVYLPASAGEVYLPVQDIINMFFLFSVMCIPYEMVDFEIVLRKDFATQIEQAYAQNHSSTLRTVKMLCRYILLIPGLFLSPLILLGAIIGLKNMT